MPPGAIGLWSGNEPRLQAFRIPPSGLELTRGMIEPTVDDKMSTVHARLRAINDGIMIEDAGSRNGTYVGGERLGNARVVYPPEVVRCGRTLFLLTGDVAKYEERALVVRHRLMVGATLAPICDQLDRAILDETSIAIAGPRWVARALARGYLRARNGGAEIDAKAVVEPLDNVLAVGSATRTVLLEHPAALTPHDLETLAAWLETDVRFVTCVRQSSELARLPPEILTWLAPLTLEIAEPRYDELPSAIYTAIAARAPEVTIHATLIEAALLAASADEDQLLRVIGRMVRDLQARGDTLLRGDELAGRLRGALPAAPNTLRQVHILYPDPLA